MIMRINKYFKLSAKNTIVKGLVIWAFLNRRTYAL